MGKESETALIAAAGAAATRVYAPCSDYLVGTALMVDDGASVTGSNVKSASDRLALATETVAEGKALAAGRRGWPIAVAAVGLNE